LSISYFISRLSAFFGTNVNKSVYFFVYGFRLAFAVFMDGDLPNSFSAASFMSTLSKKTGLSQIYTNHSIRATGATILGRNCSMVQIMAVTVIITK
jgi:hypothetical protein